MWGRSALFVGLLAALSCSRMHKAEVPAAAVTGSEPTPKTALPASAEAPPTREPSTRAKVASCPPHTKPVDVSFDPRIEIGWAGGASWLYGYSHGNAALASLDAAGKLVLRPVPLDDAEAATVDGNRILLYAQRVGSSKPTRWIAIDASQPDAPAIGKVQPLEVGAKLDWASALGASASRTLVIAGVPDERELVLLDARRRVRVGSPVALGKGFEPTRAWCYRDHCAVVAIENEGGGPERRLVVLRVSPSGSLERERLAPDWIGSAHVVESENTMIVAWAELGGLRLRWLDLWGKPLGPALDAKWDAARWVQREGLFAGPGGVFFAVGERGRWSLAKLGEKSIGAYRELPGAELYFLGAAALDDGLAWSSFSTDVDYRELGHSGAMTHSWSSRVSTGFAPGVEGAQPVHEALPSAGGPGRGGLQVYVLARPGTAAALVVPRDDAARLDDEARLVPIRVACSRAGKP